MKIALDTASIPHKLSDLDLAHEEISGLVRRQINVIFSETKRRVQKFRMLITCTDLCSVDLDPCPWSQVPRKAEISAHAFLVLFHVLAHASPLNICFSCLFTGITTCLH